jgi:hypothetical protein
VFGTIEDLAALRGIVGKKEYREVDGTCTAGRVRRAILGLLESDLRPRLRAALAGERRVAIDRARAYALQHNIKR